MSGISKIPSGPHFAIITTTSVYIPGDERSRTNPGHGYPAGTEEYIEYQSFTDRKIWETSISKLVMSKTPFRAISATPARITTTVSVVVE